MFELTPFGRRVNGVRTYNPFRELEEMQKAFFGGSHIGEFKTDIKDNGDSYLLEADLPGFKKEDIHVDMDGNYMTITAERHSDAEEKDKEGNYIRCERSYGSFTRSFDISEVKAEGITAEYKDGVLRLTMPKKEAAIPTSRRLEIQ